MDWGTALWDQHDAIEKHTQLGLDLADRYVKFVKERTDIEQLYAKQLRALCKKYSRRGSKEDQDTKFTNQQAFQEVLNELNDYATHREQLADNMSVSICTELTKHLYDLKLERKTLLVEVKKAQQNLENSFKQLELAKKRFEKEWKEAEKANLQAERAEQDSNSTKVDVDKARQNAHQRTHAADECKNEYAAQLQKYNKEQNNFYHSEMPSIFNKLQEVDEKRIKKLAEGYRLFADTERKMLPGISVCLDKITAASNKTKEKQDSLTLIEQHKSGLAPPVDVEFEDYSQGIKPASMEAPHISRGRIKHLFKKNKQAGPLEKNMPPPVEDFSHLPPDKRKKRLQERIDEIKKELHKEMDKSNGLGRMKEVYEKNSQLGDPTSLEPQINQIAHNINKLKGELQRYEAWLSEVGGVSTHSNNHNNTYVTVLESKLSPSQLSDDVYEFDEDFDDDDDVPAAQCLALYDFDGASEGAVSMEAGERLSMINKDQGDGWVHVRRINGDEGYVPALYIKII
ncbi:thyroid hormone receptor interactor 10b isoform X1 [Pygocentrus nattereri]|uniref:thyroid hormone receptor interactor 10b isoform X1 n=1 Tax=Pygocentrus nattereri TaxID=42514 RepID=UPI00189177C4|nr:thyroid hormone receptor interactor 10b isoform X1 [Pygocentrus nattereri]